MKVIKDMSCDIEEIFEMADKNIRLAVKYKEDDPESSKAYYNKSVEELNSIKPFHDRVVAIIKNYRAEKGEPPAPMMAMYNYEHEKHMDKNASIRKLQELYSSGL